MQFWTTDEFKKFLGKVSDKPQVRAGFLILYYTGLRIGELLALEYGDIDFKNCTINVNKSYQHIRGKDVVTPPKTPKIVRIVSILEFLRDEIRNYTERLYGLHKHDRIFPYTKSFFEHEMIRGTKDGDVKWIRPQDIRRSHASQLIHMDFSILAVSERLGHEKVHPPCICTVTFIRKSMAMWPSSYRTGPPNTFYRQRGKMPISAQIRKGGTLLVHFQKISPDFPLFTRKIRVITLIRTQSSPAVSPCSRTELC